MIRLGLIGLGQWGKNYIHTIHSVPGVRLERIAANSERPVPPVPDVPYTSDWRELVHSENVDAVIIATPPHLHAEMARECLISGKPALIEKPLTLDLASAQETLALAKECKVTLLVNHIHLFNGAWQTFKSAVREAGCIERIESTAGRWGPFRPDVPVLWDWGPHDIAMCIDLLMTTPESVHARRMEKRDTPEGFGETLSLQLQFPSNVNATITVSNLYPTKRRKFTAHTKTGNVTYEDTIRSRVVFTPKEEHLSNHGAVDYPCPDEPPLNRAVSSLADAARKSSHDLSNLEQAVTVIACLEKADQQLRQAAR
jgi:predicted dehydrogenase